MRGRVTEGMGRRKEGEEESKKEEEIILNSRFWKNQKAFN